MRGGIHFAADGASVVYAAGCGVALFDSGSRTQRLVPLADRQGRKEGRKEGRPSKEEFGF